MVVEEPEYTLWGWILLSMFGITPKPDHVVYRCQICRQSLGSTRNPKVLARKMKERQQGIAPSAGAPKNSDGAGEGRSAAQQGDEAQSKAPESTVSEEGPART